MLCKAKNLLKTIMVFAFTTFITQGILLLPASAVVATQKVHLLASVKSASNNLETTPGSSSWYVSWVLFIFLTFLIGFLLFFGIKKYKENK